MNSNTPALSDEEYLAEFLKNLKITKTLLRRKYGDRVLGMIGFEDFLQDAALAIWRRRADPKFMWRKALLQQKTFFQKTYYKNTCTPISALEGKGGLLSGHGTFSDVAFVDKSVVPFSVLDEDWQNLQKQHSLTKSEIAMLRMRCEGKSAKEISEALGLQTNSINTVITRIKKRLEKANEH